MRYALVVALSIMQSGCFGPSKEEYWKGVDYVDIPKYMGKWYIIASRGTFIEKGAHNAYEVFTWNEEKKRIDITFNYLKDSFEGEKGKFTHKGTVYNTETNAHWKTNPFLWFKFDFLIAELNEDYTRSVVVTPDQKYIWIMSRDWEMSDEDLKVITDRLVASGFDMQDVKRVPHEH